MFENYNISSSSEGEATIDMGPLIDMVFILLIFFVVTTNFNRQTGVDVSKPKASSAISQGAKTILVGVARDGTIHLYGRQVSAERLHMLVQQEIVKNPETSVVIIADTEAAVGITVSVMDQCILAGAQKVSIAADKE
jgi:biopolymer transport protein ExbD